MKKQCVHAYAGICRSAVHDRGKTSVRKCALCKGYKNYRLVKNEAHMRIAKEGLLRVQFEMMQICEENARLLAEIGATQI
jgi:hypothetical protein